jgi:hypothetical protein
MNQVIDINGGQTDHRRTLDTRIEVIWPAHFADVPAHHCLHQGSTRHICCGAFENNVTIPKNNYPIRQFVDLVQAMSDVHDAYALFT